MPRGKTSALEDLEGDETLQRRKVAGGDFLRLLSIEKATSVLRDRDLDPSTFWDTVTQILLPLYYY